MKNQKILALTIIAILSVALVWVLFFWSPAVEKNIKHEILDLNTAPVGGDFTVEIQDRDLSLQELRGKVIALYFGYTQCPDICPTSLSLLTQALHKMSDQELTNVQSIFISVDPERDNTTRLAEYTKYFHSNIIGATAEKEIIDKITKLYGASYRIVERDSAMGYIVDHSSYTYIIDKQGKLRKTLVHGSHPDKIVEAIRELIAE